MNAQKCRAPEGTMPASVANTDAPLVARLVVSKSRIKSSGVKPRLRGIPDVVGTILAVPAGALLLAAAAPGTPTIAAAIYSMSLVFLFGVSATYHTPMWSLPLRRMWRTIDHSAIYVLIGGSYTPICLTVLKPSMGLPLLAVIWATAIAGFAKSVFWPQSPRWVNTSIYLLMGWAISPFLPAFFSNTDGLSLILLAGGGLIYSGGAFVYQKKWMNFAPRVFGYHESFHMFVLSAAIFHYIAMWRILSN